MPVLKGLWVIDFINIPLLILTIANVNRLIIRIKPNSIHHM